MTTAAERGQDARQRLVQAAAELVAERGWTAVTTRLLAQRAGLAPGGVHYHFSSVQSVLAQAATQAARAVGAEVGAALEPVASPQEAVDVLVRALDRYSGTDPVSVLLVEAYLAAARDDGLRSALGEVVGDLRQRLAERLETHGVPEPAATAAVLLAAVDGAMLHRALMPGPEPTALAGVLRRLLDPPVKEAR